MTRHFNVSGADRKAIEKPSRPSDSPKTGDSTNVMAFLVMLLTSAGGLVGTYLYKRRKMKKS